MTKEQAGAAWIGGMLREAHVLALVPVSPSTLWRMVREGRFPRPRRISLRSVGWLRSEVEQWIQTREEAAHEAK